VFGKLEIVLRSTQFFLVENNDRDTLSYLELIKIEKNLTDGQLEYLRPLE